MDSCGCGWSAIKKKISKKKKKRKPTRSGMLVWVRNLVGFGDEREESQPRPTAEGQQPVLTPESGERLALYSPSPPVACPTSKPPTATEGIPPLQGDPDRGADNRSHAREWATMVRYELTKSSQLVLQPGDLTKWKGDAIVNAANEVMLGGGGVDGAIHRAAGPQLRNACRDVKAVRGIRCPTGEARVTEAFKLPVKYVVHTVGPIYKGSTESAPLLESAYRNSLSEANRLKMSTVAFPAISCGIYGYPLDEAAKVSLTTIKEHVGGLKEVHFVFFEAKTMAAFEDTAGELFKVLRDEARPRGEAVEKKREQGQPEIENEGDEMEVQESQMDVDPDENKAINGLSRDAEDDTKQKDSQAMDESQDLDGIPAVDKTHAMDESKSIDESPKKIESNQSAKETSPDMTIEEQENGKVDDEMKGVEKKGSDKTNGETTSDERKIEL